MKKVNKVYQCKIVTVELNEITYHNMPTVYRKKEDAERERVRLEEAVKAIGTNQYVSIEELILC